MLQPAQENIAQYSAYIEKTKKRSTKFWLNVGMFQAGSCKLTGKLWCLCKMTPYCPHLMQSETALISFISPEWGWFCKVHHDLSPQCQHYFHKVEPPLESCFQEIIAYKRTSLKYFVSEAFFPLAKRHGHKPEYATLEEAQRHSLALYPGATDPRGGLLRKRWWRAVKASNRSGGQRKRWTGSQMLCAFVRYSGVLYVAAINIYDKYFLSEKQRNSAGRPVIVQEPLSIHLRGSEAASSSPLDGKFLLRRVALCQYGSTYVGQNILIYTCLPVKDKLLAKSDRPSLLI